MLKTMKKCGITMAFFAAVLTSLTALVHKFTKNAINRQINQQQKALFDQVIQAKFYDNDLQKSCFVVNSTDLGKGIHRIFVARKGTNQVAVVMEVTAIDGYSGDIQLLVATDFSGKILGARVIEHHETPGLGDKIELRLSKWILHFSNRIIRSNNDTAFALKKDGGEFDQFTGATITPRAVVNAIKRAGLYAKTLPDKINSLSTCSDYYETRQKRNSYLQRYLEK